MCPRQFFVSLAESNNELGRVSCVAEEGYCQILLPIPPERTFSLYTFYPAVYETIHILKCLSSFPTHFQLALVRFPCLND